MIYVPSLQLPGDLPDSPDMAAQDVTPLPHVGTQRLLHVNFPEIGYALDWNLSIRIAETTANSVKHIVV